MERLCESRDLQQNGSELPESNHTVNASQSGSHDTHVLQPNLLLVHDAADNYQVNGSSSTVPQTFQKKNSQSAAVTWTRGEAANHNSCYLLYVADPSNVVMPVISGGIKMLSQQLLLPLDGQEHSNPMVPSLQLKNQAPSAMSSSVCNVQSNMSHTTDKSKPPVAVVVPWNNVSSSFPNDSTSHPSGVQRNAAVHQVSSVMLLSNQQLASQPSHNQQLLNKQNGSCQQSVLPPNLNHQLRLPQQGFMRQMVTQPNRAASQQLTQLAALQDNHQLLVQQQRNYQLVPQQHVILQQNSSPISENKQQQLSLPAERGQILTLKQGSHQQPQHLQPTAESSLKTALQQASCPKLSSQDAINAQQGTPQPQHSLQQLMTQSGNIQQLTQNEDANQKLMAPHLRHAQVGHQRFSILQPLTTAEGQSFIIRPGFTPQNVLQSVGNQQLAVLLGGCEQLNSAMLQVSGSDLIKLQSPTPVQVVQQSTCQLSDLQKRFNQQSNRQLLESKQVTYRQLPVTGQLQKSSSIQLEQLQKLLQQQQQFQQRLQQQQRPSSCLYKISQEAGCLDLSAEEVKKDQVIYHVSNSDPRIQTNFLAEENGRQEPTRSQAVMNAFENSQSGSAEFGSKFANQNYFSQRQEQQSGFENGLDKNMDIETSHYSRVLVEQHRQVVTTNCSYSNVNSVQQSQTMRNSSVSHNTSFVIPAQEVIMSMHNHEQLQALQSKPNVQLCDADGYGSHSLSNRGQNQTLASMTVNHSRPLTDVSMMNCRSTLVTAQSPVKVNQLPNSAVVSCDNKQDIVVPSKTEESSGKGKLDNTRLMTSNAASSVETLMMGNKMTLSSNSMRCMPSTVVQLRFAQNVHNSQTRPVAKNPKQIHSQHSQSVLAVTSQSSRPLDSMLPLQLNSVSSTADPLPSSLRTCSSVANTNLPLPQQAHTSSKCVAMPGVINYGMPAATIPRHGQEFKVFINVSNPTSGISSLSSIDIESANQHLVIGQECELRYSHGPRFTATWDGKYFVVKHNLNQESDVIGDRQSSVKGGGLAHRDGQQTTSSCSSSGLRNSVNDSATSCIQQGSDGHNSSTVSLARPPLHSSSDGQSTPSNEGTISEAVSSIARGTKRPTEDGKFAICNHCGTYSPDYTRCDQCRRLLPDNVKFYEPGKKSKLELSIASSSLPVSQDLAETSVKNQTLKCGMKRNSPDSDASMASKTPQSAKTNQVQKKVSAKQQRKQEEEIIHILSSDEEEEDPLVPCSSSSRSSLNSTASTSSFKQKTKKLKDEPQLEETCASVTNSNDLKSEVNSQLPKSHLAAGCQLSMSHSFNSQQESVIVRADVLHVFFGFIKYNKKSVLILEQNSMLLQSADSNKDENTLIVASSDIHMVGGHINQTKCLTCLFILITPNKASDLRKSLNSDIVEKFDPASSEDCAKYIVLFLADQKQNFLSRVELTVQLMQNANNSNQPHYKSIDNFDVEKYLNHVCPGEDHRAFFQISSVPSDVMGAKGISVVPNQTTENEEEEEDVNYGSRSPSPVHALFSAQIIKLFTYPPAPATGGITVTNEDLYCLNEGEFLNDVIIDFYLKYLMLEFLTDKFHKTHVFSSFFYRRLTQKPSRRHKIEEENESIQQRRHSRIRTWTRHVDLFEKDFIIVPINESAHWYLAVICYPGLVAPEIAFRTVTEKADGRNAEECMKNDEKKNVAGRKGRGKAKKSTPVKPKTEHYVKKMPCILVFDSLAGPGRNGVIRILREYLQIEWDVRKKDKCGPRQFTKDNVKGAIPECPQQSNFSDCGIYVLQYVESFFTDPIQDFTFPLKLLTNWFDENKVRNKRSGLQQLIIDMQKRYNPGLEYSPEKDGCIISREVEEINEAGNNCCSTETPV